MELTIDNQRAILGKEQVLIPASYPANAASIEALREGRKLKLTLPRCPTNDRLFGRAFDPETATRFNATRHRASLSHDAATLFEGSLRLMQASTEGYRVELREGGADWATAAALTRFNALKIDYNRPLTPTTIHDSWSNEDPVRFFPIHRDSYEVAHSSLDLLPTERLLSVDDYHPFLHLETIVKRIFTEAGYTIRSRFLESSFFRSLYMSGAYTSRDTTALAKQMGFRAARLNDVSATANRLGRVYTNPFMSINSIGNLVESATPQSIDSEGKVVANLYNHGDCFKIDDDGSICYTPLAAASIGFEYHLRYTTQHRIRSRTQLTGFDSIYLGSGNELRFTLANRYVDRRNSLNCGQEYRIIVFDHNEGDIYRLYYSYENSPKTLWCGFSTRSTAITTPASATISNPQLEVLHDGVWVTYTGDWAIYDGYIEEVGKTIVELRIRTASEPLTPSSPKRFDNFYLFGAEPGMQLTIHAGTTIESFFRASPGYGTMLRFADVAHLSIRQIDLLEALAHLFNLRFSTDEARHEVTIEPFDTFYTSPPIDWRPLIDREQPIVLTDLTTQLHAQRAWGYAEGDGVVKRFERETEGPLGYWRTTTDSEATLMGTQTQRNPLFAPTVSSLGHYANAPSARLLQIGDRDTVEADAVEITPRIVSYCGLHSLAEGERWGFPADDGRYPLAVFHFAGDDECLPVNLGFEDREGVKGLHRFYDRQLHHECYGGLIELSLRIPPHRFEALMTPRSSAGNLQSTFRLATPEGEACGILLEVGSYDAESGRLNCTLLRTDRTR